MTSPSMGTYKNRFNFEGYLFPLFIVLMTIPLPAVTQKKFIIDSKSTVVDARIAPFDQVLPGDTLFLAPGPRQPLLIHSFRGEKDKPVVFMNFNGQVTFDTDHYYAISIHDCRHIRLSGEGDPDHFYGIRINRVTNGAGIGIGSLSTDYEIDHISIENVKTAGIYAKTDPDCSLASVRGRFLQTNTIIRDNYIGNVGVEGMYVGSTQYFGQKVSCNGKDTLLMPHLLENVRICNNIIKNSGWDGIQVSSASGDCRIYNNTVLNDSQAGMSGQMSGIIIGGGSRCDCYNNLISHGNGNGIEIHGIGGSRIFNNIILYAGRSFFPEDLSIMKHGIFVTDVSAWQDSSFHILHNHIIHPKSDGIRFQSVKTRKNLIASNLIVNPGNFDFYENGNFWFKGKESYVFIPNPESEVTLSHNFTTRDQVEAMISENDLSPLPGSPLIDAALSRFYGLDFDFNGHPRPKGQGPDIGALESDYSTGNRSHILPPSAITIFPNPVATTADISFYLDQPGDVEFSLFDSNGSLVQQEKRNFRNSGNQVFNYDLRSLSNGLYFLKILMHNNIYTGKILKEL